MDSETLSRLIGAFPRVVATDVGLVAKELTCSLFPCLSPDDLGALSLGDDVVKIPLRLYLDEPKTPGRELTTPQRLVLACLFTRHHDGFVRERYLRRLLSAPEAWTAPYVLALVGEYVAEIITRIEQDATSATREQLIGVALANPDFAERTRHRLISYWDCYYRQTYPRFSDYPGYRLLHSLGLWPNNEARRLRGR